jgi:excisionase family DNA binding protein
MNRMRTIEQVYDYIKQQDPETAISKTAVRTMVIKKDIPSVKVGAKYLINLDHVDKYLCGEPFFEIPAKPKEDKPIYKLTKVK